MTSHVSLAQERFHISGIGAEESYWIAVRSARTALAAALSQMVEQHEVTEGKAPSFAHACLHDTAEQLYPK